MGILYFKEEWMRIGPYFVGDAIVDVNEGNPEGLCMLLLR